MKPYTTEEMNAALSTVQEKRLTTPTGPAELRANGLPAGIMPYALSIAEHNLEKWALRGVQVQVPDAFAAGWMDGLLVGMALRDIRKP
jgi:hypothetical protein